MINYYKQGQRVRVTCSFRVDGVATDPTSVTCKIMDPTRSVSTPTVSKSATGVYYVDVIANKRGEWNVRFEGTGACTAVEEIAFGTETVFP
jgi:hypothetical protein